MSIEFGLWPTLEKTHHLPRFPSQTKPGYNKTEHTPVTSLDNNPTDTSNSGKFTFNSCHFFLQLLFLNDEFIVWLSISLKEEYIMLFFFLQWIKEQNECITWCFLLNVDFCLKFIWTQSWNFKKYIIIINFKNCVIINACEVVIVNCCNQVMKGFYSQDVTYCPFTEVLMRYTTAP